MERYLEMKEKIAEAVKANLQDAIALNDDLADHPELSGEEYESSRKIVELLKHKGFDVEYPFAGLPTSFKATYGRNDHKYKVAIMTEYDALPGIGQRRHQRTGGNRSIQAAGRVGRGYRCDRYSGRRNRRREMRANQKRCL